MHNNTQASQLHTIDILRVRNIIDTLFTGDSLEELEGILAQCGVTITPEIESIKEKLNSEIRQKLEEKLKQIEENDPHKLADKTRSKAERLVDEVEREEKEREDRAKHPYDQLMEKLAREIKARRVQSCTPRR